MPSKGDFISDGYALEHRVVGYLESEGYFAIKSHMSKGIVDVVGLKPNGKNIFVQCKLSEWGGQEFDALKELNEKFEDAEVKYATLETSNELKFQDIRTLHEDLENPAFEEKVDDVCVSVFDLIKEMADEFGQPLSVDRVKPRICNQLEITDEKFEDYLERIKREGKLFEPAQGEIQTI